jgi:hypothetical protein
MLGTSGESVHIPGNATIAGTLGVTGITTASSIITPSVDTATSVPIAIGGGNTTTINIGRVGQLTTVLGNFSMSSTAIMNVSNASFTNVSVASLNVNGTISTNTLNASGTITANLFNSTSDIRFKNVIRNITIEETLDFINNTNPILFKWKNNEKIASGYIAQQVMKTSAHHLVEISDNIEIKETSDGPEGKQYYLNYDGIIPYHGVAIKHILNENKQLKNDIDKLSNIIDQLYRDIQILKNTE